MYWVDIEYWEFAGDFRYTILSDIFIAVYLDDWITQMSVSQSLGLQ